MDQPFRRPHYMGPVLNAINSLFNRLSFCLQPPRIARPSDYIFVIGGMFAQPERTCPLGVFMAGIMRQGCIII
jgi:hypothetical protein